MKNKKIFLIAIAGIVLLAICVPIYATEIPKSACVPISDCGPATALQHCKYKELGASCYECSGSGPLTLCVYQGCLYLESCEWDGTYVTCGHHREGLCYVKEVNGATVIQICIGGEICWDKVCKGYGC